MAEPIISVEHLRIGFGDVVLHEDVSFRVERGEVFAILGGSGSGKTVLMKNMIGLYTPLAGRALIGGEDIARATGAARLAILKRIGVMYQLGALFGSMTLAENVRLPLEEYTDLPDDAMELVARMKLELVQLQGAEGLTPAEISGGMMKRAAIARAMALDPDIVFLDEPSGGLDPITSAELDQLILRLRASLGITFVVITHELASIFTHRRPLHHARQGGQRHHRRREAGRAPRPQRQSARPPVLQSAGRSSERMSRKTNYFKLGLFVIAAVVIAIAIVLALGAGNIFKSTTTIETYFDESVQGLDVGSAVKYRGVQIGRVTKIGFTFNRYQQDVPMQNRKPYVLVEAELQPQLIGVGAASEPERLKEMIAAGLRARLAPVGITGTAYLEIDFVDPKANPPLTITWVPLTVYIPSAPSTYNQIISGAQKFLAVLDNADVEGTMHSDRRSRRGRRTRSSRSCR